MKNFRLLAGLLLLVGVSISFAASIPPTAQELADLKNLPQGYAVWGVAPCVNLASWTPGGMGVYRTDLGDTAAKLLDANGTHPSINPKDPSMIAYFVQTTATTADVWLMDWQGNNKRKITKTPLTESPMTSLRWTDQYKLVFTAQLTGSNNYSFDHIYIMDTLGTVTLVNTGITWQNANDKHGYDGVMAVGNRIIFRAQDGIFPNNLSAPPFGNKPSGIVVAEFDQNNPQTQISKFILAWGQCGGAFTYQTVAGVPLRRGENNDNHDGYMMGNTDAQVNDYTAPLSSDIGENFHFWNWAVNDTNWAYVATRKGTLYPYVVHIHQNKIYRIAFNDQGAGGNPSALNFGGRGAAYGALYIGTMVIDSTKLTLSAPAAGSKFTTGDTLHVKWQLLKNQSAIQVSISPNNGTTWCPIGSPVAPGSASWGDLSWVVTDSLASSAGTIVSLVSTTCLVKVENAGATTSDQSGAFTIRLKGSKLPTNYALHACLPWDGTSNSTTGCYGVYTGVACNAFDGDKGTASGQGRIWPGWPNPTLVADFGQVRTIDSVVVYFEGTPTHGYAIEGTNTLGAPWTSIRSVSALEPVSHQANINASFRYMRIAMQVEGNDPGFSASVFELQMWGSGEGTPVTPGFLDRTGWVASASNSSYPAYNVVTQPSAAIDGNATTNWSLAQQPGAVADQWFMVDMKQEQSVGAINIVTGSTANGDYLKNYAVYVSNDQTNWGTAVATGTGNTPNLTITLATPKSGRYLKIAQTGGGPCTCWWGITELNVAGGNTPVRQTIPKIVSSRSFNMSTAKVTYFTITGRKIASGAMVRKGAGMVLSRIVDGKNSMVLKQVISK